MSYCRKTFFDRLEANLQAQTLASVDVLAWSLHKGEDGVYQTESDQLYVPDYDNLRRECFELVHSDAFSGHFGIARTIVKARRHFFWPTLSKDIKDWVTSCDSCQRVKALRQKAYGKLQPLQIPGRRWESISMDLITDLPVTPQGHDSIWVVVDRLSKMVHLVPTTKTCIAEQLAKCYEREIVRLHGLPDNIVSDRDVRFVSRFWQTIHESLGTELFMFTEKFTLRPMGRLRMPMACLKTRYVTLLVLSKKIAKTTYPKLSLL